MAKRGAKAENGEGKTGGPEPTPGPGIGHNDLSEDEKAVRFFSFKKRWEAARASIKIVEEDAKSALGKHAIRDIRTAIKLETPEGEAKIKELMESQLRIAHWMAKSVGTQASFLDDDDRTPAVDRAAAEGRYDGLACNPCKPAYDPSLPQYASYMKAWQDGQATRLKAGIKPMPAEEDRDLRPETLRRAEAEAAMRDAMRRATSEAGIVKTPYFPKHQARLAPWISAA